MMDTKDYSYNIFENVSKEQFILDVNSRDNKSLLFILGSLLPFGYVRENRVIIDVTNYEEVIINFNSFNIFKKYCSLVYGVTTYYIIRYNFDSYIDSLQLKQITYQKKLIREFHSIRDIKELEAIIVKDKKVCKSKEVYKILIESEIYKNINNRLQEQLDLVFSEFDFQNNLKTKFSFYFHDFVNFRDENQLTDVHLDGRLFNNFTLSLEVCKTYKFLYDFNMKFNGYYGGKNRYSYPLLLDDYHKKQSEFFDNISVVAEYLGYKVYIKENGQFIFNKK